jgi:hypothetical protein
MKPATIIRDAEADGVNLTLSTAGKIKASGNQKAVSRWLVLISENKPGIIEALQPANELRRLVRLCGEFYGFTDAEHAEALTTALADFNSAMKCFSTMEHEIKASKLIGNTK